MGSRVTLSLYRLLMNVLYSISGLKFDPVLGCERIAESVMGECPPCATLWQPSIFPWRLSVCAIAWMLRHAFSSQLAALMSVDNRCADALWIGESSRYLHRPRPVRP